MNHVEAATNTQASALPDPQVGDVVLVAIGGGYIMKVQQINNDPESSYLCHTFPDASYRWEHTFPRSMIYQVLILASGIVLADPESIAMRQHRFMQERKACVMVYDRAEDAPWRQAQVGMPERSTHDAVHQKTLSEPPARIDEQTAPAGEAHRTHQDEGAAAQAEKPPRPSGKAAVRYQPLTLWNHEDRGN